MNILKKFNFFDFNCTKLQLYPICSKNKVIGEKDCKVKKENLAKYLPGYIGKIFIFIFKNKIFISIYFSFTDEYFSAPQIYTEAEEVKIKKIQIIWGAKRERAEGFLVDVDIETDKQERVFLSPNTLFTKYCKEDIVNEGRFLTLHNGIITLIRSDEDYYSSSSQERIFAVERGGINFISENFFLPCSTWWIRDVKEGENRLKIFLTEEWGKEKKVICLFP